MIRNVKAITFSAFLSMFFLGVASSLIGAAARNIGLSPFQIGLLIAIQNLGFMLSVSLSGALADTHEKPKILLTGSLILAVAFLTFYLSDLFLVNVLIMFFIGVGIGTYEGVTDAMLFDIHREKESLYVSVNHFFVTFGSIMIALYLLFLQMNWRYSVVQSGLVVLLLALFFALIKLEPGRKRQESYLTRLKILTRNRLILAVFLATILAVGVEVGSIGILTTYLMELRGFSQVTSKLGLIVFLGGMASGRLLIGFLTREQRRIPAYILTLFALSSFVLLGLYFLRLDGFSYILIYLAGLAISAVLPLMLTLAGLLYKDMAGTVLGVIKVAIPLGGMFVPFVMSMITRASSFQFSLLIFPLSCLVGFIVLYLGLRQFSPVSILEKEAYES